MTKANEDACAYVGIAACGHFRMAVVDTLEHTKEVAKSIAMAVRRGLRVERMTTAQVRAGNWGQCETCRPKQRRVKS